MRPVLPILVALAATTSAFAAPQLESTVTLGAVAASVRVSADRYLTPGANLKKAMKLCEAGKTDALADNARFAAIHIDWNGVSFAGEHIVDLEGGWLSKAHRDAGAIPPLLESLRATMQGHRQVSDAGCAIGKPGELLLLIDQHVPAETLNAVLQTAGTAGYRHFAFGVDASVQNGTTWEPANQDGWEVYPKEVAPDDPLPTGMAWLKVQKSGFVLLAQHETLARHMVDRPIGCERGKCQAASDYDWDVLGAYLAPIQKDHGSDGVLGILVHRGATADVVVRAISASSGFSRVVLAGSGADNNPGRRGARVMQDTQKLTWTADDEISVVVTGLPDDLAVEHVPSYPRIGYISDRLFKSRMAEYTPDARLCYIEGLDVSPSIQGDLTASFVVQGNGELTNVVFDKNTLNSDITTECFKAMFARMRFPAPQDKGPVNGRYTYSLTTEEGELAPIAREVGLRVRIRRMPKESLKPLVEAAKSKLHLCAPTDQTGVLGMDIAIDQYGAIKETLVTVSPFDSPEADACITRALYGIPFTGASSIVYHVGLNWPSLTLSAPVAEPPPVDEEAP